MADEAPLPSTSGARRYLISVDAMGGDRGPVAVVAGLVLSAAANPDADFILHGDQAQVAPLLARQPTLQGRVTFRHAPRVVSMTDKPSQVMRHGEGTSMWSCIDAVKNGEALAAVSCGNTGALMLVAMIRLRKLPGVNRPAIACLWPSRNPGGYNLLLDVGADVRADPQDYVQYAMMGASYARNGMQMMRPRIGLLNVGTEDHKGRAELKTAADLIAAAAPLGDFDYVGFVEGGDIPSDRVDVIVTDGFTGNVALKTGEGTAKLVSELLRTVFTSSLIGRIAGFLVLGSLQRLQRRIDPRRVNGGVFLGLNGTVVKSHGSADETGVAAAIALAVQLSRSGFRDRLAVRLASVLVAGQDAPTAGTGPGDGPGDGPSDGPGDQAGAERTE